MTVVPHPSSLRGISFRQELSCIMYSFYKRRPGKKDQPLKGVVPENENRSSTVHKRANETGEE
jgi:hypothetical protein